MIDLKKPHKHAEVIKAWADGASIEYRFRLADGESWSNWHSCDLSPGWLSINEYRVKPHKWQKEMDAYAAGKAIQHRWINQKREHQWEDVTTPHFLTGPEHEYRIKPEVVVLRCCAGVGVVTRPNPVPGALDNLELTFEDGVLIYARVLQPS
jgi:hypothetical protein